MSRGLRGVAAASALVAVAALATVLISGPRRDRPRLPTGSAAVARPQSLPAPLDARQILTRAEALELTPAERARLEDLDRRWRRRERELLDRIENAQREISGIAAAATPGRPVGLRELRERAAGFSELSAELREARARHAEDAVAVLTARQGRRLEQMTTTIEPGGANEARTN